MTYYGRWTYKYEIAAEKGAAAAVIVHETGPAGYPYEVVTASWGRENFEIQTPDRNMARVAVEAWIHARPRERVLHKRPGRISTPQKGGYPQGLQAGATPGEGDIQIDATRSAKSSHRTSSPSSMDPTRGCSERARHLHGALGPSRPG